MEFIETDIFTKRVVEILTDEEYCYLQALLVENPSAGDLIPCGMGLRKLRWAGGGKGKRGGLRVIYYLINNRRIYMIYLFKKSKQEDLSLRQLKVLAQYVKKGVL